MNRAVAKPPRRPRRPRRFSITLPRFRFPQNSGQSSQKLNKSEIPVVVGWRQGNHEIDVNLLNSKVRIGKDLHDKIPNNKNITPTKSFRILKTKKINKQQSKSFRKVVKFGDNEIIVAPGTIKFKNRIKRRTYDITNKNAESPAINLGSAPRRVERVKNRLVSNNKTLA